jgi:hypothetical protein
MVGCIYYTDRVKIYVGDPVTGWSTHISDNWDRTFIDRSKCLKFLNQKAREWLELTNFQFIIQVHAFGDYAWLIFDSKEEASLFRLAFNLD